MTPAFIDEVVRVVTEIYGETQVRVAKEGSRTLVRIAEIDLDPRCRPTTTPLLLLLEPDQAKPIPYVRPGVMLPSGNAPRSTSPQIVGGEPWLGYSFQIPWSEEHGIIRFIAAARQRFAQND